MHFEKSGPEASQHVLLLHGWGSSSELMRPLARLLEDRFFILNPDLPGHGKTPPPDEAWGVPEYAESLAQLIKSNLRSPVTIVGHSNGGRLGLFMAANPEYRDLVRRLILISPSGMQPTRTLKYLARKGLASTLKAPIMVLPGRLRRRGLEWLRESAIWRALGSSDYKAVSGVMRETFVKTVTTHLDEDVRRISVPTLVFWGSRDYDVGRDQVERLIERVPDAGLVVLDGAGHYSYLDDPATIQAGIIHFMEHS